MRLLFVFLLVPLSVRPQTVDLNRTIGQPLVSELAHALLLDPYGDLIVVGKRGGDALFAKYYPATDTWQIIDLEQRGQMVPYAVVAARDGGYWLAGTTTNPGRSDHRGGQDAMLLKLDHEGGVKGLELQGSSGDDRWLSLNTDTDGNLLTAGQFGRRAVFAKFAPDGTELWQRTFNSKSVAEAKSILELSAGRLLVGVNSVATHGRVETVLLEVDATTGNVLDTHRFPDRVTNALLRAPDGSFRLIGMQQTARTKRNGSLTCLSANFKELSYTSYGDGSSVDEFWAGAFDWHGNLWMAGLTGSGRRASDTSEGWLLRVGPDGQAELNQSFTYRQHNTEHQLRALILGPDGRMYGGGFSGNLTSSDLWLVTSDKSIHDFPDKPVPVTTKLVGLTDQNGDAQLEPREQGYMTYEISNPSTDTLQQLRLDLTTQVPLPAGLEIPETQFLTHLPPAARRQVHFPFRAGPRTADSNTRFELQVRSDRQPSVTAGPSETAMLRTVPRPAPRFVVQETVFYHRGRMVERIALGDTVAVHVRLRNEGNRAARTLRTEFHFDRHLTGVTVQQGRFDAGLAVDAEQTIRFAFVAGRLFAADRATVNLTVSDDGEVRRTFPLSVEIRPSDATTSGGTQPLVLVWRSPNLERIEHGPIRVRAAEYAFELVVVSPVAVSKEAVTVLLNKVPVATGARSGELSISKPRRTQGDYLEQTISGRVLLPHPGEFYLSIQLEEEVVPRFSDAVRLNYQPDQYQLHVYTFGIPGRGLAYTVADAADVAAAFRGQHRANPRLERVNIKIFNTPDSTNMRIVSDEFYQMFWDARQYQTVLEDDLTIIFFAGHGNLLGTDQELYLIPYDYRSGDELTALNYRKVVLERLEKVPGRKLILLDVCHSGDGMTTTERKTFQHKLTELHRERSDMAIMVASGANEWAYEDDAWRHGAFTWTILRAFRRAKGVPLKLHELGRQVVEEVPPLVRRKKEAEQHPQVAIPKEWKDFYIYF